MFQYIPDVRERSEEGAKQHEARLEDLERAAENERHARTVSGRSRRWLWMVLAVVVLVAVLFVVYQIAVPSDAALPTR